MNKIVPEKFDVNIADCLTLNLHSAKLETNVNVNIDRSSISHTYFTIKFKGALIQTATEESATQTPEYGYLYKFKIDNMNDEIVFKCYDASTKSCIGVRHLNV